MIGDSPNNDLIAELAVRIFSETGLDEEDSVSAANEIWHRANGSYFEPALQPEPEKPIPAWQWVAPLMAAAMILSWFFYQVLH